MSSARVLCAFCLSLSGFRGGAAEPRRGADVPWVRCEGEDGQCFPGTTLVGSFEGAGIGRPETSGAKAVKLSREGSGVRWKAPQAANSIVVRACIPDTPDGKGEDVLISLFVNDVKKGSFTLTSKYTWLYGPEDNPGNDPSAGGARRVYDDARRLFDFTIQKGDTVTLKKDAGDHADYYCIDFIELEMVPPPLPCPDGFINVANEGLTPENFGTKIAALIQSVEWKEGYKDKKGLYIPPGRWRMAEKAMINSKIAPGFAICGAGMWHTELYDDREFEADWGTPGFNINGQKVSFSDFAIFGAGRTRKGSGKAFFNSFGDGSRFTRIWVEHMTCGFWVGGGKGVTNNLTIDSCRLRNLGADGINLCNGTKNSTVVNTTVRASGDDGIAIWSAPEMDGPAGGIDYPGCANNVIKNCTVELPWRASGIAIYGGKDNTVRDCIVRDTLTYPGITVSSTFKPRPFEGTTRIENVTLERCGGAFWKKQEFGALWVMADDSDVTGVVFKDIEILDAAFSAIQLKTETYKKTALSKMDLSFDNIRILNPGNRGLYISDAMGTASFKNTKLTGPKLIHRSGGHNGHADSGSITLNAGEGCEGFAEETPAAK